MYVEFYPDMPPDSMEASDWLIAHPDFKEEFDSNWVHLLNEKNVDVPVEEVPPNYRLMLAYLERFKPRMGSPGGPTYPVWRHQWTDEDEATFAEEKAKLLAELDAIGRDPFATSR